VRMGGNGTPLERCHGLPASGYGAVVQGSLSPGSRTLAPIATTCSTCTSRLAGPFSAWLGAGSRGSLPGWGRVPVRDRTLGQQHARASHDEVPVASRKWTGP
jgi:hypothetical protein